MTLDVTEALSNDTTNHRHHHDHRLDMTLDVPEALREGNLFNFREYFMTLDVSGALPPRYDLRNPSGEEKVG